uniref:Uncharacterized protein n=1 Tax=Triticum urartu TaxID=4572 RepID=A0A8R7V4A8_TRIUA
EPSGGGGQCRRRPANTCEHANLRQHEWPWSRDEVSCAPVMVRTRNRSMHESMPPSTSHGPAPWISTMGAMVGVVASGSCRPNLRPGRRQSDLVGAMRAPCCMVPCVAAACHTGK